MNGPAIAPGSTRATTASVTAAVPPALYAAIASTTVNAHSASDIARRGQEEQAQLARRQALSQCRSADHAGDRTAGAPAAGARLPEREGEAADARVEAQRQHVLAGASRASRACTGAGGGR